MPTQATVPSAKLCCFQIGTRAFTSSISSFACSKSLTAVAGGDSDHDRKIANRQQPGAMDGGEGNRVVIARNLFGYLLQHGDRVGVRLVAQRGDVAAAVR